MQANGRTHNGTNGFHGSTTAFIAFHSRPPKDSKCTLLADTLDLQRTLPSHTSPEGSSSSTHSALDTFSPCRALGNISSEFLAFDSLKTS